MYTNTIYSCNGIISESALIHHVISEHIVRPACHPTFPASHTRGVTVRFVVLTEQTFAAEPFAAVVAQIPAHGGNNSLN